MVDSTPKDSGRKLFYGLFIFPLLIAVGMAVLLCTVVVLTKETETPESLITAIKTGAPSKRWQKAFELSNELNLGKGMIRSEGVMKEVIHILNNRQEYDEKTRSYMALALSHFNDAQVVPALLEALKSETAVDVQLFLLWSLGVKKATEAEKDIQPFLSADRTDLKSTAAYVLGVLGSSQSIEVLKKALTDPYRDVRWNAALSLARLGSDSGFQELATMLDRKMLEADTSLAPEKIEEIMVSAIKGMALLGRNDARFYMEPLSAQDKSLKVRQAALDGLKHLESPKGIAA